MGTSALRAEFPVLRELAYLNAGTDGPLPARAVAAARAELERQEHGGRAFEHFERRRELNLRLRATYAGVLGCAVEDVALTSCTSEGLGVVLSGLGLGPGDEVLTSDEEHPGLLGALAVARDTRGVSVRMVPWPDLADAVDARTRAVACSHVSWMTGRVAPGALAEVEVPVVLDGAQGAGAVHVDVHALGCDAYAAAGQKWMCGPDGTGMLYVSPSLREQLTVTRLGYINLADAGAGIDAVPREDAGCLDAPSLSAEAVACAGAAADVLAGAGWDQVHARGPELAHRLTVLLEEHGRQVAPRADTTLVSFTSPDPAVERLRLAEAGVIVRDIPGRPWLRASVGAWNDEGDLDRLVSALGRS
jgi:L-cysteine/cystine lyase